MSCSPHMVRSSNSLGLKGVVIGPLIVAVTAGTAVLLLCAPPLPCCCCPSALPYLLPVSATADRGCQRRFAQDLPGQYRGPRAAVPLAAVQDKNGARARAAGTRLSTATCHAHSALQTDLLCRRRSSKRASRVRRRCAAAATARRQCSSQWHSTIKFSSSISLLFLPSTSAIIPSVT